MSDKPGPVEQRAKADHAGEPDSAAHSLRAGGVSVRSRGRWRAGHGHRAGDARTNQDGSRKRAYAGFSLGFYNSNVVRMTSTRRRTRLRRRPPTATFCCTPEGARRPSRRIPSRRSRPSVPRPLVPSVSGTYAPPADGPIAFSVYVPFGPPGAAPPPPPPPPPPPGAGAVADVRRRPARRRRHQGTDQVTQRQPGLSARRRRPQRVQGVVIIEARIEARWHRRRCARPPVDPDAG